LTVDTEFRAIVKNGLCPQDISDTVLVSIDAESIGGNLSGPSSICTPPNSVAITLNNHQGNISDWEYSEDNGATWQSLGQSSNPLNLSNVTQTTMYRAIVQNGSCTAVFSDTLEIIVISNLDGGVLSPGITSVCEGANSGTIDLNGYVGNIDYWEYSNDQVSWTTIPNSTSAYSFSNLNNTTYFRVIVSGCTTDTSSVSEVNVSTLSSVGSLGSDITICQNESVMNLSPSTYNADNFNWESSVDGGNTWQSESSSIPASFLNVSQSKLVRLIVQNGACPSITSDTINILVDSLQFVSGFVAKDSVCEGNNSDTIVPTIITGNVNTWVNSIDGGLSWIDLGVSLDSLITNNVTATTIYGVVLSSGVCPVDTFYHEVMVSQPSSFGSIVGDSTVCINTSNHSVYLSNQVADSYVWYSSLDSNTNYSIQNSSIDSLFLSNVDEPIYVYCEVNNGVCPSVISDTIMIDVFSANYGITGDTVVALYSSVELTAFGGVSYSWDANSALDNLSSSNVNAQINNPEIFYVNITDINGCDYRDSISIDVINEAFEISTLITANNDGYNDFWIIKKPVDVASVKVTVLNVFGQIVYSSNDYQNDWDAHYENKILPNGTYYFIVEEESIGKIKGNLNIVGNEK
jgi:gliding motility-associated-like protein